MLWFTLFVLLLELIMILRFKSLLLQLVILVAFFPLVTLVAFINGLYVPGILAFRADRFSENVLIIGFFLLVLANFILISILYPLRHKTYSYTPFKCTTGSSYILLLILLFSAIISYPRVFGVDIGLDMSTIYISTNVALFLCKRERNNFCSILHLLILLIVLIGGDRVDSIISLVFLCAMGIKDGQVVENIKKRYIIIGGALLFSVSIFSGLLRGGQSLTVFDLFYSLYAQQTVSDVLYVFLCSISYYYENGADFSVLFNMIFGLFPGPFYGVVSPYNYTIFLNNNFIPNPGGGLYFSEGMLAFGPIGVLFYSLIYALCFRKLFVHRSRFFVVLFLVFVIMLCRMQWYGFIYAYKPIIFSYIFYYIMKRSQYMSNNLYTCSFAKKRNVSMYKS